MTAQMLTMTSTISHATRRARPLATLPPLLTKQPAGHVKTGAGTSLTLAAKGAAIRMTLAPSRGKQVLRLV